MSVIRNTIKIIKLRKIEKVLVDAHKNAGETQPEKLAAAKAELFQLVQSQRELRNLMEARGVTTQNLDEMYEALCQCAGAEVKKLFVPAEALAYRHSLKYVLDNAGGLLQSEERRKTIGWVLTTYFQRNDILDVNEARYLQEAEHTKRRKAQQAARRAALDKKLKEREARKMARVAAKRQQSDAG